MRGILQLALSLALLAWLANRVGFDVVVSTLAGVSWTWYLPAFLVFLGNVLLRAYRWHVLVTALGHRVSYGRLLYLYFLGFFFNNFIPSGFGGDVVKVLSLRRDQGRGAEALSSVVMDRLTGLIGSASIALVVLIWNGIQSWFGAGTTELNLPSILLVITALVSIGIPAGFVLIRWVDPLELLSRHLPSAHRVTDNPGLRKFVRTIRYYPPRALVAALSVSLPFTVGLVVIQYAIARALTVDVPFYLFFLFVPLIAIINTLPVSFNGLGMREGVYQFLFVPAGVSSASAIAMSLAFYFLRVAAGLIGGLLYAVKSVRRLARAT
ncbi:MAG: lysylphosphatidylglycerol synthase transmembrane domain-containing protein [Anaerolineae bacterium]